MNIETLLLEELVKREGQAIASEKIGCHQTAISAAIKKKREIYIEMRNGEVVAGYEVKSAFKLPFNKNKKA